MPAADICLKIGDRLVVLATIEGLQWIEIGKRQPKIGRFRREKSSDKYFPSYLVRSEYQNQIFHVLFAADVKDDNVRIVTAYWPDPDGWEQDLRKRRQP